MKSNYLQKQFRNFYKQTGLSCTGIFISRCNIRNLKLDYNLIRVGKFANIINGKLHRGTNYTLSIPLPKKYTQVGYTDGSPETFLVHTCDLPENTYVFYNFHMIKALNKNSSKPTKLKRWQILAILKGKEDWIKYLYEKRTDRKTKIIS